VCARVCTCAQTKGSRRNWIRQQIIPEMIKNKLSLENFAERKIIKLDRNGE
jgi:hypothetical protein